MDSTNITGADLRRARRSANITLEQATEISGRHRTTLTRMENGQTRPDVGLYQLWKCMGGVITIPGWHGWVFDNGYLFPPGWDRHGFTPAQIMALQYNGAQIRALKEQLKKARGELKAESQECMLKTAPVFTSNKHTRAQAG